MDDEQNPYEAPKTHLELAEEYRNEPLMLKRKPLSFGVTALKWFVICSVSAVPSFFFGIEATEGQFAAMVLGILIFAVGYTFLDYQTRLTKMRQSRFMLILLRVVYGTRIFISVIFPIGMIADLYPGALAIGLTQHLFGQDALEYFLGAIFTTLLQGVFLNAAMAAYGLLVAGVLLLLIPAISSLKIWLYGPKLDS